MAARLSQSPCMNCEYGEAPECTGYALLSEQEEINLAQYRKARGSPGHSWPAQDDSVPVVSFAPTGDDKPVAAMLTVTSMAYGWLSS